MTEEDKKDMNESLIEIENEKEKKEEGEKIQENQENQKNPENPERVKSKNTKEIITEIKNSNAQECVIRLGGDMMFALTFLGRMIITLYSFHGLFFIYNFIIQFIILVPGILYGIESKILQYILGLAYLIFGVCISDVLVIPTFDFLSFPFLLYRNPLAHIQSFYYIIEDKEFNFKEIVKKNNKYINAFIIIIELFYAFGFILGLGSVTVQLKDQAKIIILIVIYAYYLIIFFNYIFISFYFLFQILLKSKERYKKKIEVPKNQNNQKDQKDINNIIQIEEQQKCCGCYVCCDCCSCCNDCSYDCFKEVIKDTFDFEKFFEERKEIPDINLLSYVVRPLILNNYINNEEHVKDCGYYSGLIKIFIKVIFLIFALILVIAYFRVSWSTFIFIVFFLIILVVCIIINFQSCFRNKKTFGHFWSPKNELKNPLRSGKMVSAIRFFCFIITLIVSSLLCASFFFVSEKDQIEDFPEFYPSNKTNDKRLLLPNICTSSVYGVPIYLYLPFINDAYYYNNNPKITPNYFSSLNIKKYRQLFFDDSYEIVVKGNLIKSNSPESVKMIQYNVKTSKDEVTILSIKGTSNKKDIYLDFQLYFQSVLLNILSTFSIFGQQKETLSFKVIEYSLSIPYRLFSHYLIIDGYLNDLKNAYIANQNSFYKNVVIVGHSLGGGLCKLLGRLVKQQAISLSGPGINAFQHLWGYEGQSENFEISAIDLVPDMDLVPRVEVSGGTIYRIVCKEGPLDCHSKVLSLCEILIMCRNQNYEEYCRKMANLNDAQINSILEGSELNEYKK